MAPIDGYVLDVCHDRVGIISLKVGSRRTGKGLQLAPVESQAELIKSSTERGMYQRHVVRRGKAIRDRGRQYPGPIVERHEPRADPCILKSPMPVTVV